MKTGFLVNKYPVRLNSRNLFHDTRRHAASSKAGGYSSRHPMLLVRMAAHKSLRPTPTGTRFTIQIWCRDGMPRLLIVWCRPASKCQISFHHYRHKKSAFFLQFLVGFTNVFLAFFPVFAFLFFMYISPQ